jgi:hypothetical protein
MSWRLTVESSLHQVSVNAKRSRSESDISSNIRCSLLLIDLAFNSPHFVPEQVLSVFSLGGASRLLTR